MARACSNGAGSWTDLALSRGLRLRQRILPLQQMSSTIALGEEPPRGSRAFLIEKACIPLIWTVRTTSVYPPMGKTGRSLVSI